MSRFRLLMALAACLGAAPVLAAPAYKVVDLGPTGLFSNLMEVNEVTPRGMVVGTCAFSDFAPRGKQACVFTDGAWHDITHHGYARGVGADNAGDVLVEAALLSDLDDTVYLYPADGSPARMISSPTGSTTVVASGITGNGLIGGYSTPYPISGQACFLWRDGVMATIPAPANCNGRVVNEAGWFMGTAQRSPTQPNAPFTWDGQHLRWLPRTYHGAPYYLADANAAGHAVGGTAAPDAGRALLWDGHDVVALGVLPGLTSSYAAALNDHDQVVGVSKGTQDGQDVARGFLYDDGTLTALADLVHGKGASHWTFDTPTDINDAGVIVGTGTLDGVGHGWMLVPAGHGAKPRGVPAGYVLTPHGWFDPACLVSLAGDEQVLPSGRVRNAAGSERSLGSCAAPHFGAGGQPADVGGPGGSDGPFSGWIEWSYQTLDAPAAVKSLEATWTVPSAPSRVAGQTLYIFPGARSYPATGSILQPVLAWNAQGDQAWSMTNWNCCIAGKAYSGSPMKVATGDVVRGKIEGANCGPNGVCHDWSVRSADLTTGRSSTFKTKAYGQAFNNFFGGVLEAFGLSTCDQMPANGSIDLHDIVVTGTDGSTLLPTWSTQASAAYCATGVAASADDTSLTFSTTR